MTTPMMIRWLWTKLRPGEFPKIRNYERVPKLRSCMFLVIVTSTYTLLRYLWSMCQLLWWSVSCGQSYKQGNSLRCEIENARRTWVLGRFWSKWHWNMHYWVASEVYANSHDEQLAVNGDIPRGIPWDAKLETQDEHEILHVSGQSDIERYIIGSTLKYMPRPMTICWTWTELQAEEFPQMRN